MLVRSRQSFFYVVGFLAAVLIAGAVQARADDKPPTEHQTAGKGHDPGEGEHDAAGEHHKAPTALEHVMDSPDWHLFQTFGPSHIHLPNIGGFQITKFMILEVFACLIVAAIYIPMARRLQSGEAPRGAWDNTFESLLTFIREEVAKPNMGEHDADRFLPFLWTIFLFVLANNLLGMVPFMGSATSSIYVTGGLAIIVFFAIHGSAIAKMGFVHYLETLWPHFDVPFPLGYVIKPVVFVIELVGVLVRNAVLAVRLFANMFAGHMVLATILIFIYMAANTAFLLWGTITVASVFGNVALSMLELFVAFLQAYIFVFLTSLFIGMAVHPEH
jgi:F-type H+-transporting ATPase subunit a